MTTDRKQALTILIQDSQGRDVGGLILLDQGNRQHRCDWYGGCTHQAIIAIVPSTFGAAPQLACSTHFSNMHLAIWRQTNPPRLVIKDGARLLAKNEKVRKAS